MEIKEAVKIAKDSLEEKKGYDLKIFNLEGISAIADYFIIANGNNKNQMQAMSDEVSAKLAGFGIHTKQVEGYDAGNWILMDYGDFMVHIFNPESRDFYNLERLWRDAKVEEL